MEIGTSFRSTMPKYPTADPNYRILSRQRSRYAHYYFYVRDPVLGPIALCVGSFLPFSITYYLNGHHFIEQQLRRAGVEFRKDDNAFLWVADQKTLQAAADALSAKIIRTRLEYWTLVVGPKFSKKDRQAINLGRRYSLQQVEYCRNLIFRRNFPIHKLFDALLRPRPAPAKRRSHRASLRLAPAQAPVGQAEQRPGEDRPRPSCTARIRQERGDAHVREVLHLPAPGGAEQQSEGLRVKKGLDNLDQVRRTLAAVTDRFAAFEAQALNVHVDFRLFQRLALPIPTASGRVPGIKIHDTRMLRLMEVLLHAGTKVLGWRTAEIHQAILASFSLAPATYTLTQLRYDLRKMKAHGLLQRDRQRYVYRLTDKGTRVALLFVLFHQRVCGPLANSLFRSPALQTPTPMSKIEAAYHKANRSIEHVIQLLAA
jgi:hypothetical protein